MVGLHLVMVITGCLMTLMDPAVAYRISLRDEGVSAPSDSKEGAPQSPSGGQHTEQGEASHGVGGTSNSGDSNKVSGSPPPTNGSPGTGSNQPQTGTGQFQNYQPSQNPNYQPTPSNQAPNYQYQVPSYPQTQYPYPYYQNQLPNNYQWSNVGSSYPSQYPSYQNQVPSFPQMSMYPNQNQIATYQNPVPMYQQGTGQGAPPNYQQSATPGQGVLSHDNPDELVKDKSEAELRKLVASAIKEMKEIAGKVMFWHHMFHDKDKDDGNQNTGGSMNQQPQNLPISGNLPGSYTGNPPQQYSGPMQQPPLPYNPQPYYGPPQQTQYLPQQYNQLPMFSNPQPYYGQPVQNQYPSQPFNQMPQPFNQMPQPFNQMPQQFNQMPQPFNQMPQPFNQIPQLMGNLQLSLPPIVIPPGTFQYQRLVRRLFGYLRPSSGLPEMNQQYVSDKLWSSPLAQHSDTQPQLSNPLTLPESVLKSVLPPVISSLVQTPTGYVVMAPSPYLYPYTRPDVTGFRGNLPFGLPIIYHDAA